MIVGTWPSSFVSGVNVVFTLERVIHEKYSVDLNVEEIDQRTGQPTGRLKTVVSSGKGGEYESQIGFGWTNGVVLDFMHELEELDAGRREGDVALEGMAHEEVNIRRGMYG